MSPEPPPRRVGALVAVALVALCTLLIYPLKQAAPVVSLGVVYMLAVVIVSVGISAESLATSFALATPFASSPPLAPRSATPSIRLTTHPTVFVFIVVVRLLTLRSALTFR